MDNINLTVIRTQHKTIMADLKMVEECHDLQSKNTLYRKLKTELLHHIDAENETCTHCLDHEHHQMKEYLQRLNLINMSNEEWIYAFREMKEFVEDHCKYSEASLLENL